MLCVCRVWWHSLSKPEGFTSVYICILIHGLEGLSTYSKINLVPLRHCMPKEKVQFEENKCLDVKYVS